MADSSVKTPVYLRPEESSLTISNMLELGVLDVFYDAYCELEEYYDDALAQLTDENGKFPPLEELKKHCHKKTRQVLEDLVSSQSYLFVSGGQTVHVNAPALTFFEFAYYDSSHPKPMHVVLTYKVIPFKEFLIGVQEIVVKVIQRWKYPKNEGYRIVMSVNDEFNKRINKLVETKRLRRIVNTDSSVENTDETLWIFERLSQTSCYRKNHPIEAASYIADVLGKPDRIRLPVHYCPLCNKYFIGKTTLELYDDLYGKILADRRNMGAGEGFDGFQPESRLHQLGYNVIAGNMSTEDRHALLIYLLKKNKITYVEMCNTIEQDIKLFKNSDRHWNAVKKWKDDLLFIGDWVKENSRPKEENR